VAVAVVGSVFHNSLTAMTYSSGNPCYDSYERCPPTKCHTGPYPAPLTVEEIDRIMYPAPNLEIVPGAQVHSTLISDPRLEFYSPTSSDSESESMEKVYVSSNWHSITTKLVPVVDLSSHAFPCIDLSTCDDVLADNVFRTRYGRAVIPPSAFCDSY